jgi:hypothetical protein
MKAIPVALACLLGACATPATTVERPPVVPVAVPATPSEADELRRVVTRFLDAAEAGRFDDALPLLSAGLRDRYTVERLRADFAGEPLAKERLARARRGLDRGFSVDGPTARLPLDDGHHLRAVREDGSWKIAALEE